MEKIKLYSIRGKVAFPIASVDGESAYLIYLTKKGKDGKMYKVGLKVPQADLDKLIAA